MAGVIVTDLILPQLLIDYVRQYDMEVLRPEAQLTLDTYLPNRFVDDLDFRIRKGALNDVDAAEFRAWDTPAAMTGRPGVTYIRGSLGPVSRQIPLGEEEYLRTQTLLRGSNDPVIQAIYDDSERMIRSVQARIELARGDVINDGKLTIAENGMVIEADFGRAALMSKVAANLWTDATLGKPLTDMLAWMDDYVTTNGVEPGVILMSRTRVANLALNTEIRNYAAASGTIPTRVNAATIADIFAAEGLPPIDLYDTQVRVNGTRTRILPVNKVFFMPPASEPVGHTFYGITSEALLLAERNMIDQTAMPGVVAVITREEHPVQTYTVGTALAMPVLPNPNLILDAVVA